MRNGKPFAENVKRIIVFQNSSEGETTDEFDPGSALGKSALRQFNLHARFKSKQLPFKDIKTGVGTFKCDETNYSGFEGMQLPPAGNGDRDVDDEQAIPLKVQHIASDVFVNEKSPFGLVHSIYKSERVRDDKRQPFATVRFTLKETGTGAKSAIDYEKISGKMP